MSQEYDVSEFRQRSITDYLILGTNVLYVIGALLFVAGLWVDWQDPGAVVISAFVFAEEPHNNSGLFVAAIILFAVGFLVSRVRQFIESRNMEEIEDQTQEWVVDVDADR